MPRHVWREVGVGVVYADDWRLVTQNAPSTVPAKFSTGNIRSDVADDYDGTAGSNGGKLIIHWTKPIKLKLTHYPYMQIATTYSSPTGQFTLTAGTVATMSWSRRIRPILADFDPATVTWANTVTSPTLTYGTSYERTAGAGCSMTGAGNLASISVSGAQSNGLFYGVSSTATMYGLICDVKATLTSGTGTIVNGARWPVSMTEWPNKPFVIPPT